MCYEKPKKCLKRHRSEMCRDSVVQFGFIKEI